MTLGSLATLLGAVAVRGYLHLSPGWAREEHDARPWRDRVRRASPGGGDADPPREVGPVLADLCGDQCRNGRGPSKIEASPLTYRTSGDEPPAPRDLLALNVAAFAIAASCFVMMGGIPVYRAAGSFHRLDGLPRSPRATPNSKSGSYASSPGAAGSDAEQKQEVTRRWILETEKPARHPNARPSLLSPPSLPGPTGQLVPVDGCYWALAGHVGGSTRKTSPPVISVCEATRSKRSTAERRPRSAASRPHVVAAHLGRSLQDEEDSTRLRGRPSVSSRGCRRPAQACRTP